MWSGATELIDGVVSARAVALYLAAQGCYISTMQGRAPVSIFLTHERKKNLIP